MTHWKEHVAMVEKLTPPPQMDIKASVTCDINKIATPGAQAKAFQAFGLQVAPQELEPEDHTHEIIQEKEGLDAQGIPTKTKVSVAGKPLK